MAQSRLISSWPLPKGIPGGKTLLKSTPPGVGILIFINDGGIIGGNGGGRKRDWPTVFGISPLVRFVELEIGGLAAL